MEDESEGGTTRPLPPTLAAPLFAPLSDAFVALLRSLGPADWERPTVSARWNVREIAAHVLDGQLRRLSFQRDAWLVPPPERPIAGRADLVAFLDGLNASWVSAARRLSPRVLTDLLERAGREVGDMASGLDPCAPALFAVAWAGEAESLVWFDLARDLTEHWHHQQQIRLAVGAPLLLEPRFSVPVLDTFARALPHAYRETVAPGGAAVAIAVTPPVARAWALVRAGGAWTLEEGEPPAPAARIAVDGESAWRILTGGLDPAEGRKRAAVEGDERLAAPFFTAVAIMK
ncbi:MAG: maleylpyruvate isomerase N-terminal domain-containing protein [Acidobacteriota bacterium]